MKTKQILITFILIFCVTSTILLIQSCSSDGDDENNSFSNPKVEALIASSEYKTFNDNIINFGETLKSNYSTLSDEDKEKVVCILNDINNNSNSEEKLKELYEQFCSIMKIDFEETIDNVNESAVDLNLYKKVNNISNEEFSLAVSKYSMSDTPRLKSSSESDQETQNCIMACSAVTAICCAVGLSIPFYLMGYAACCITC